MKAIGIQTALRSDQKIKPVMRAANGTAHQHRVITLGITHAVLNPDQLSIAQHFAGLKRKIAQGDVVMRTINPASRHRWMAQGLRHGRRAHEPCTLTCGQPGVRSHRHLAMHHHHGTHHIASLHRFKTLVDIRQGKPQVDQLIKHERAIEVTLGKPRKVTARAGSAI